MAERERVSFAGGDLVAAPQIFLAATAVGYETEVPLVTRAGARSGDVVAVTGELGGAAAALELLDRRCPGGAKSRRNGAKPCSPASSTPARGWRRAARWRQRAPPR